MLDKAGLEKIRQAIFGVFEGTGADPDKIFNDTMGTFSASMNFMKNMPKGDDYLEALITINREATENSEYHIVISTIVCTIIVMEISDNPGEIIEVIEKNIRGKSISEDCGKAIYLACTAIFNNLKGTRQDPMEWYKTGKNYTGIKKDGVNLNELYMHAQNGDPIAQCNLGYMYEKGIEVEENQSEAFKWYLMAANSGNAEAEYNVGYMYHNGKGTYKDCAEAVKWYKRAADKGIILAQNNLGYMYENGIGTSENLSEAVRLYRLAAEQGDASAQNNLGVMYQEGLGVNVNFEEAMKWYEKSAHQGHQTAVQNLENLRNYRPKKGCFLTTAACEILNKDDDCYELEQLRKFRDNVLMNNEDGKKFVEEYYKIAPAIADKLKIHPDKVKLSRELMDKYINAVITYINNFEYGTAIKKYREMVDYISKIL